MNEFDQIYSGVIICTGHRTSTDYGRADTYRPILERSRLSVTLVSYRIIGSHGTLYNEYQFAEELPLALWCLTTVRSGIIATIPFSYEQAEPTTTEVSENGYQSDIWLSRHILDNSIEWELPWQRVICNFAKKKIEIEHVLSSCTNIILVIKSYSNCGNYIT